MYRCTFRRSSGEGVGFAAAIENRKVTANQMQAESVDMETMEEQATEVVMKHREEEASPQESDTEVRILVCGTWFSVTFSKLLTLVVL